MSTQQSDPNLLAKAEPLEPRFRCGFLRVKAPWFGSPKNPKPYILNPKP